MKRKQRVLAIVTVVGMIAGLGTLAFAAPAQAAPKMTVEGNSNLKGGEKVKVTVTGFTPNNPVAIGMCPTGRELKGAGDCGPAKDNMSVLTATDASGSATAELTVPDKGKPLGNTTGAPAKCPPCSVAAANIQKASETASVKLNYAAGGGGGGNDTADTGNDTADTGATDDTGSAGADNSGGSLSETGPQQTLAIGTSALALVLLGMVVLSAARYRGAHRAR